MKTIHSFRIVDEDEHQGEIIFPEVDMKICSEASLDDMLGAFQAFLQAVGYTLPENSYLDFVEEAMNFNKIEQYKGDF